MPPAESSPACHHGAPTHWTCYAMMVEGCSEASAWNFHLSSSTSNLSHLETSSICSSCFHQKKNLVLLRLPSRPARRVPARKSMPQSMARTHGAQHGLRTAPCVPTTHCSLTSTALYKDVTRPCIAAMLFAWCPGMSYRGALGTTPRGLGQVPQTTKSVDQQRSRRAARTRCNCAQGVEEAATAEAAHQVQLRLATRDDAPAIAAICAEVRGYRSQGVPSSDTQPEVKVLATTGASELSGVATGNE